MIPVSSKLTGEVFTLSELEQTLKPLGYQVGGNWDYDHGYFDYKIADDGSYQFLRVPFTSKQGNLDDYHVTVEIGEPFLLAHKYQRGMDDHVHVFVGKASIDQFSEPVDPDASVPDEMVEIGRELVRELEAHLLR
ncbi:YugN-like family protein [Halobacillus sp. MO56]